jgi:hypothetical protein
MLVAEKRHRNRKRLRCDRGNIGDERLPAVRQHMPKQDHKSRIQPQRDQRIRSPYQQEPDHLARRQNAPQRGKRTMSSGIRRRLVVEDGGFVAGQHTFYSRAFPCCGASRRSCTVAFPLGETPISVAAPLDTHRGMLDPQLARNSHKRSPSLIASRFVVSSYS